MAVLNDLSDEILLEIIHILIDGQNKLHSLSLVNRRLNKMVIPILMRHIDVYIQNNFS